MVVRMTTQLIWHGREIMPGETVDLPDDVARRYVETFQAEHVLDSPRPVESANTARTNTTAMRDMRGPQAKRR